MINPAISPIHINGIEEIEFLTKQIKEFKYLYDDYLFLFEKEGSIQTLQNTAADFFYDLFYVFQEYFSIRAARFLDPAQQAKNKNITVNTIINRAKDENWFIYNDLLKSHEILTKDIEEIRLLRNKQLAHLDHETQLIYGGLAFLPPITLDDFIRNAMSFINLCRAYYEIGHCTFLISGRAGSRQLIKLLNRMQESKDDQPTQFTPNI